jgi:hypothetical protein
MAGQDGGSGDFHEKAVTVEFVGTWFFYSEWAALARWEWIALPSELAVASGSRLDPKSLLEERDHLVIAVHIEIDTPSQAGRRCCAAFWLTSRSALPNWRLCQC